MNRPRAAGTIVAVVALMVSLLGTSHGNAVPRVKGDLAVVPAVGAPGTLLELSGRSALRTRHRVHLQRRARGTFVTLKSKRTDADGKFTFRATLRGGSGFVAYRVLSRTSSDSGLKRMLVTPTRTVLVTPGTTTLVTSDDGWDPAMSGDGRFIAFADVDTYDPPVWDLYVWDRAARTTTRITRDGTSGEPAISSDGRFIAFVSAATDPISDDRIGQWNVFVWDRVAGTTTRVSDGVHAAVNPAISADGRYIAFDSSATVDDFPRDVFVWDRDTGTTSRVTWDGASWNPAISGDGHFVAFASATDPVSLASKGLADVRVVDRTTGKTLRVSHATRPSWLDVHPAISANGRRVAYEWRDDVFVWDRRSRATTRIADGLTDGYRSPSGPAMSANGRYVTWDSWQVFLPGDRNGSDVFVWDHKTDALSRITNGRADSIRPTISADGRRIAYSSGASDLVPHGSDTNEEYPDVFVWDRHARG